jgi:hypothetical protein
MLDNYGYKYTLRICNTLFFHGNNGYVNVPQCYVLFVISDITEDKG